ncbi:MAG: hypothetical protein DDT21_01885 [Syntrophomonadaceae bacterium]|nr:hypothetical protein [Bacillota bacterium]
MQTVKVVLQLPEDIAQFIEANSTPRTKGMFVADCIRKAMRREQDGDGILERLASAAERVSKAMEKAQ